MSAFVVTTLFRVLFLIDSLTGTGGVRILFNPALRILLRRGVELILRVRVRLTNWLCPCKF